MRRAGVVLLAAMAAVTTSCGGPVLARARSEALPSIPRTAPQAMVTAASVTPDPRIGAIFLGSDSVHTCTGSVIHSTTGDLILTAAHCMAGGADASFVPAFAEGAVAQHFWHIDTVYLDPRWVSRQDPLADFAIARLSRQDGGSVESVVGGGFAIGSTPAMGTDVVVTGYALGVGGGPIGCAAHTAALEHGYPSMGCAGLVDGTSGAPWLNGSTVVGITGGYQGGGCEENVSYTPPFDGGVKRLVARAEAGGAGDDAPTAFEDGC
jgi:hypothetical protein